MRRFYQQLLDRIHLQRIKNARNCISGQSGLQSKQKRSSKHIDGSQAECDTLLYLYNADYYQCIPIYNILKTTGLQQYTKSFIERGFGVNVNKLAKLTEDERYLLFEDLKVLPGHGTKLRQLFQQIDHADKLTPKIYIQTKSSLNRQVHSNLPKSRAKKNQTFGFYESFVGSVKATIKRESSFQAVSEKYTKATYLGSFTAYNNGNKPHSRLKPQLAPLYKSSTTLKRSTYAASSQEQHSQRIDKVRKLKKSLPSLRMIPKDSVKEPAFRRILNKTCLDKKLVVYNSELVNNLTIDLPRVRDLNASFDGAMMGSTIVNIDVQYLVYAFAGYVAATIVVYRDSPVKLPLSALGSPRVHRYNIVTTNSMNVEKTIESYEVNDIAEEVYEIVRNSRLHPLYQNYFEYYLEAKSPLSDRTEQLIPEIIRIPSADKLLDSCSLLSASEDSFHLADPHQIFNEPEPTELDKLKPTIDSVANFIKNIVLAAKMEREIPIMAAYYLKQYLILSHRPLTNLSYKRLLVTVLLLASKIWDDESFETHSFVKAFPSFTVLLINEMEKVILKTLYYRLKLDKKCFAAMYFELRVFTQANNRSFKSKKFCLQKVRELQNGVRKNYRTNFLAARRPSF